MNILFFCGSLAPGRDGVGDYTRRLAKACVEQGHACTVIALHDPAVIGTTEEVSAGLHLIRLPAKEPWIGRLNRARRRLNQLAPDRVSWQLVAQGFHPRGFLPAALLEIAPSLRGARCHVMMHELWLGLEAGAGWSHRSMGCLQRRAVLRLLKQLAPDHVSTSNATYRHVLAHEGYASDVLPLFGNVPVVTDRADRSNTLAPWLPHLGPDSLVAVTFGTLHPQWHPAATADWLRATGRRLGRPPALLALGRAGRHAPAIIGAFRARGIHVSMTEELNATDLSRLLLAADIGIAPHPWALIGKSGAAAAMLDHGLPVLVPRDDWRLRGAGPADFPDAGADLLVRLAGLDDADTDRWLARRRAPAPVLSRSTRAFLAALENSGARVLL